MRNPMSKLMFSSLFAGAITLGSTAAFAHPAPMIPAPPPAAPSGSVHYQPAVPVAPSVAQVNRQADRARIDEATRLRAEAARLTAQGRSMQARAAQLRGRRNAGQKVQLMKDGAALIEQGRNLDRRADAIMASLSPRPGNWNSPAYPTHRRG